MIDPPSTFAVRAERPEDRAAIRRVHERAFAPRVEEAVIVEGLRTEGALATELSLVALRGDDVVGHVCFSRARLTSGVSMLVLGPMGVVPELQCRGAGSELVREALRRAEDTDLPLVSVLGHASYYPRFGFEPAVGLGVAAPFEVPAEAWMAYRLPAYSPAATGTVVYAAAFGV